MASVDGQGKGKGVREKGGGSPVDQEINNDIGMKMPLEWLTKNSHGWGLCSYLRILEAAGIPKESQEILYEGTETWKQLGSTGGF